jgi:hypothetical protein
MSEKKRRLEDWDGYLLKLVPQAAGIIAPVAEVKLITHGSMDEEGRLRHPSVWHSYSGMVAFFDFDEEGAGVRKPQEFWTDEPIVHCSLLEAFSSAWAHHYILHLREQAVWDMFRLQTLMMNLLMDARVGVGPFRMSDEARQTAQEIVADSLRWSVRQVEKLIERKSQTE